MPNTETSSSLSFPIDCDQSLEAVVRACEDM
jgi:hypothetical protein